ncbi:phosphodiester glycosidase family protein [Leptolyngbya cf. ectocarpi LEGE 11479]|uniref:Phosphodiester glycosidase family protein n=1 Tax=Leptolyngbya cf. ectocarpi LEGE 11479 TaxID=1828722 RepID=A0A928ZZP7_LEPEC|nr:phosphodiester glycosidase family protein [Leptolyngbya ectocarpi]MBE9070378.1 phosphodiester glycosidase family protein [Leptolyngbya cf. ectocarpi LEGE 11479]
MSRWRLVKVGVIWLGLLMPLALHSASSMRRPRHQTITRQPLFQGIVYSRQVKAQPRPQVIHSIEIDLTAPGLRPFVTPGPADAVPNQGGGIPQESLAQRTSDFVQTHGLQLAINANFFYPFRESTPWNYGPRAGQRVNIVGIGLSDGELVSIGESNHPSLCLRPQQAAIRPDGDCPNGTQAVAGKLLLVDKGQPTAEVKEKIAQGNGRPYPFTIAAVDTSGTRLWLVLADGKQPLYAEGSTLQEMTDLMQAIGADRALQLDGGGSATLAISSPLTDEAAGQTTPTAAGSHLLNVPAHVKVPGQERPVANHLGFFAQPLETSN